MTIKFKGKEYPVSTFKVHVHDSIIEKLEWIKETLKFKTNLDAFITCVNTVHNQLQALDQYYKEGNIPETPEVKRDEDDTIS